MPPNDSLPVLELDQTFDNDSNGATSDYFSDWESDASSLINAARNHTFENGRRYHGYKEGKYMVPNDEAEQDRMDLFHHCMLLSLHGELFAAPVGKEWKPQRILDIGTGSGIWAIDTAEIYPEAEVIGVDLSAIQHQWVPPNVKFEVDDIEEDWIYEDNSFDLIHIRHMAGHIDDWPRLYRQAFKALKPGGWVEVQDIYDFVSSDDDSIPNTSAALKHIEMHEKIMLMVGRQFNTVAPGAASALEDVGCVDVGKTVTKLPCGRWPKGEREKILGMYWLQNSLDSLEAFSLAPYTRILGWEKEDVSKFIAEVSADLKNPKFHVYSNLCCAYGRKPCL